MREPTQGDGPSQVTGVIVRIDPGDLEVVDRVPLEDVRTVVVG